MLTDATWLGSRPCASRFVTAIAIRPDSGHPDTAPYA